MKLSQFNYSLTQDQIAQYPAEYRDESRLLVLHKKTGEIEHKIFKEITQYCSPGDIFVFNNTKVFPARLKGNKEKTGAEIEVFLLRELNRDQRLWDVLVDPARKIRIGNKLYFGENDSLVAEVIDNTTSRGRTLRFLYDGPYEEFKSTLYSMGEIPLPRYVRPNVEPIDNERFQSIFAKEEGAVASPAAGLHFSREVFKRMEIEDINVEYITLHMGLGHFRTVDVEDLSKHKIDSERVIITEEAAENINKAKISGKKVFAVGVTVVRALETPVTTTRQLKPFDGWTNKFIFPPYSFSIPDAMVTNFHMPGSTMLMSAASFGGFDNVMRAYKEALDKGYKFGMYGDAMLIID
ncbi:MAG: tRNA preQ1(34) S-adenosylmethionine ribosyltransferase-isomerase QueA [Bacteroidales bacterium]|nr:tRNA preQ1(34) S-adenosylmethionine ribosyltransferase-isomerase QueA [Bacteroidales bacterium]